MRKKGFTLVELLVVISVISLLMAILVPALARTRQQGKTVMCLSNLRQLVIAAYLYANSNDGYYPIAYMGMEIKPQTTTIYEWDFIAIKDWSSGKEEIIPGILWRGETIEKIHQCPSYKGSSNTIYDSPYTGYNYNTSYIGHGIYEKTVTPARMVQVKRPSDCALFGDGGYADGANKFMRAPWPSQGDNFFPRSAGTQDYRHLEKTNVAYCDGSARSTSELYKETDPADVNNIAPGTGFLSPDNSAYDLE